MKKFTNFPTEQGRYADLRSDFMMKKVFSHKELLLSFINAVIPDKNFVDLTFNNTQQLSDQKEFGSSVYDVYCTTSSNEEIVVEIQQIKQNNFPDRVVYYSTYLMQKQRKLFNKKNRFRLRKKKWSYDLRPIIIISIVDFRIFSSFDNGFLYSFHIREDSSGHLMSDKLRFIYLELPAFLKDEDTVSGDLETWTFLFNNMNKLKFPPSKMTREPYDELFNLSEIANFAENEYDMYLRRQKERDDDYSRYVTAYSDGEKKGSEIGFEKGSEIGFEKGTTANKLETARRMKEDGVFTDLIVKYTGLDKETVEGL